MLHHARMCILNIFEQPTTNKYIMLILTCEVIKDIWKGNFESWSRLSRDDKFNMTK